MKKIIKFVTIIIVAFLLVSCKNENEESQIGTKSKLIGTSWMVVGYDAYEKIRFETETKAVVTIAFRGDVVEWFGTYWYKHPKLGFVSVAGTLDAELISETKMSVKFSSGQVVTFYKQ